MADAPATQLADLLPRWTDTPLTACDVFADLDRRGWPARVGADHPMLAVTDPGWGFEQGYFLLVLLDESGLCGFTAHLPTGIASDPVPSAVTVGAAAQRLWGEGHRVGPGCLAWDTPRGRCEMRQAEVTVVSWWHTPDDAGGDGRASR